MGVAVPPKGPSAAFATFATHNNINAPPHAAKVKQPFVLILILDSIQSRRALVTDWLTLFLPRYPKKRNEYPKASKSWPWGALRGNSGGLERLKYPDEFVGDRLCPIQQKRAAQFMSAAVQKKQSSINKQ
jgi:hypothetical protein